MVVIVRNDWNVRAEFSLTQPRSELALGVGEMFDEGARSCWSENLKFGCS